MKPIVTIVALICLIVVAGVAVFTQQNKGGGIRLVAEDASYAKRVERGYWITGNSTNPKFTLTEYCDFQSPACAAFYSLMSVALRDNGSDFALVWHSYPIKDKYGNARVAALAAEAAGRQGAFWRMHQLLFVNQASGTGENADAFRATVIGYAQSLGINVEQFKSDLDDTAIQDPINKDITLANAIPIGSTPTLLLGDKIVTPLPGTQDQMSSFIQAALQSAK
jgi:protein-disulfide isomerase